MLRTTTVYISRLEHRHVEAITPAQMDLSAMPFPPTKPSTTQPHNLAHHSFRLRRSRRRSHRRLPTGLTGGDEHQPRRQNPPSNLRLPLLLERLLLQTEIPVRWQISRSIPKPLPHPPRRLPNLRRGHAAEMPEDRIPRPLIQHHGAIQNHRPRSRPPQRSTMSRNRPERLRQSSTSRSKSPICSE